MPLLKPENYAKLTECEQYYYVPIWKEHSYKKVREYLECDCCGHKEFIGWVERKTPIGEPYGYKKIKPFFPYILQKTLTKAEVDRMLQSNVIASRLLK